MTKFETYVGSLLQKKGTELDLDNLKFDRRKTGNSPYPVTFQNQTFGYIIIDGPESATPQIQTRQKLEDLACQLACLMKFHDQKVALELDSFVERLAGENPETYNWTGIYLLDEEGMLELAAFRGEKTPHLVIPTDSGICGAAVREEKTLNIPDVNADSRYLSCSIKTKSEIVVPIFDRQQKVIGEIDIDSHTANAFTVQDEKKLAEEAGKLTDLLRPLKS